MTVDLPEPGQEQPSRQRARVLIPDLIAIVTILCASVCAYHRIVGLWWMWDDPYHLNRLAPVGFKQIFLTADFWRAHPSHVYTPLLFASLKSDLLAFGLDPRGFYLHQLAVVAIAAVAIYCALRIVLDPVAAGATALIGVLGPAFATTVPQIMTRHYFEGVILATVSLIAFARKWNGVSVVSYLLSTLAKEVFVPLPLLLLVAYPKRWKSLVPHGVALVAYAMLRIAMVGSVRAYGFTVPSARWPLMIATAPLRMIRSWVSDAGVAGVCLVVGVLISVVVLFLRDRTQRIRILAGAAVAIVPVLPVSIDLRSRFVLVAWLLACVAAGLLLRRYAIVLLAVAVVANRLEWASTMRESVRMSDEARVFETMSSSELLFMPHTPAGTLAELGVLAHSEGRWLYDQQPLCGGRVSAERVLAFDPVVRQVRAMVPAEIATLCAAIRAAPLSVTLGGEGDKVFWQLGPYELGRYNFVLGDGQQGLEIPRDAGFRRAWVGSVSMRVRYDSPEGWSTYSPDFTVDLTHGQTLRWQR